MKKNKLVIGLASTLILSMGCGFLVSCGKTTTSSSVSVTDKEMASIKVKDGTILKKFQQHYNVVDATVFKDLVIETLNKSGETLGEVKYSSNPASFSHTDIKTDVLGNNSFTLTYTVGGTAYTASVAYEVIYDIPNRWGENLSYANWKNSNESVNDAKNIKTGTIYPFMKASKFYIGNQNTMNLFPQIIPESEDLSVAYVDTLPANDVSVNVTSVATGKAVALEDVFEDSINLRSKGDFKFKDTVTGDYQIVFTYNDGAAADFPALTYNVTVVNGYNINNAKDLFVLNNDDIDGNSGEGKRFDGNDARIKAWKDAKGIPSNIHPNVGVFQKDIVLGIDDIPDQYVFNSKVDGTAAVLDGTLKDYAFLLKHTFLTNETEADKNFNVYGNFHQLSLAKDFPFITLNDNSGNSVPDGNMVEGHATIFGTVLQGEDAATATTSLRNSHHTTIQDLKVLGNQGVSTSSDGLETGVIFFKNYNDSEINNCVVTNFYNGIVVCRSSNDNGFQDTITLNSTRMNNTFCSSIFNWNSAKIVINDSEILNAGGPLIFNQSTPWDYTKYSANITGDFSTFANPKPVVATLAIDDKSFLENWVAGAGGWFKQYKSETAVGTLKTMNQLLLPNTGNKTSFLDNGFTAPSDTSAGKINLVALTMINGAGATASQGAVFAKTTKGTTTLQDYDGGRADCITKLLTSDFSGLYTTPFGALSVLDHMYNTSGQSMLISNGDGSHYATLTGPQTMTCLDAVVLQLAGKTPTTTDLDSSFQTTDYLSMFMLGSHQGTNFAATAAGGNPYASYIGSNSFGLLLGTKHPVQ
jgi:hypothetical protein